MSFGIEFFPNVGSASPSASAEDEEVEDLLFRFKELSDEEKKEFLEEAKRKE